MNAMTDQAKPKCAQAEADLERALQLLVQARWRIMQQRWNADPVCRRMSQWDEQTEVGDFEKKVMKETKDGKTKRKS